jgi:hypothetical protein
MLVYFFPCKKELHNIVQKMDDSGQTYCYVNREKQRKAGISSVPSPNPEKKESKEAKNATNPMVIYSISL